MYFGVNRPLILGTLNSVESDGSYLAYALAEWTTEDSRLVHIVPDATHTRVDEGLLHVTPPLAHLWPSVIGKDCVIRPDVAVEDCAVSAVNKHVFFHAFPVDLVIGIGLHARVDNGYNLETGACQISGHGAWIAEALWIPGEDAVAVHVVDVQVNGIARDVTYTKLCCHLTHFRFCGVAPTALMIAERPAGRKRHGAQQ